MRSITLTYNKRVILKSIKKINRSGDNDKIKIVNKLYKYYIYFDFISTSLYKEYFYDYNEKDKYFLECDKYGLEDDKYGLQYLSSYMDEFANISLSCITNIILSIAKDKQIDPFCKYLMFTHLYNKDEIKEKLYNEVNEVRNIIKKDIHSKIKPELRLRDLDLDWSSDDNDDE